MRRPALLNRAGPAADAAEQSLIDFECLLQQWQGVGRLGYAITPRFAPTSSDAQLRGAGELGSPLSAGLDPVARGGKPRRIAWRARSFPQSRSYLATYADFGLMRERAVYADCIHFDDDDRALMRRTGAAAAVCPTSNQFWQRLFRLRRRRTGCFPLRSGQRRGRRHLVQPVPHHARRLRRRA